MLKAALVHHLPCQYYSHVVTAVVSLRGLLARAAYVAANIPGLVLVVLLSIVDTHICIIIIMVERSMSSSFSSSLILILVENATTIIIMICYVGLLLLFYHCITSTSLTVITAES